MRLAFLGFLGSCALGGCGVTDVTFTGTPESGSIGRGDEPGRLWLFTLIAGAVVGPGVATRTRCLTSP